MSIAVVFEDNHVVVVDKPVGIATMGTAATDTSLAREIQSYLKQKYNKPGNVYLGIVSRLDTVTSGLIVFAKTSKAAHRLTTQFQQRMVEKWYVAAIPTVPQKMGTPPTDPNPTSWIESRHTVWEDIVWKDETAHRMRVKRATKRVASLGQTHSGTDGDTEQTAKLSWRFLGRGSTYDLVLLRLMTGRKHQIRVQLADRGLPVLGDRKYGSSVPFSEGIALHSWRLDFFHPITKQRQAYSQNVPNSWSQLEPLTVETDLPIATELKTAKPVQLLGMLATHLQRR
ncbi:MAG: RNA pseudouridine synthase [Planctomycetaceae bacterium]|nr:RNA pseudouridine synthase [Planctomycetaceae bacterium]